MNTKYTPPHTRLLSYTTISFCSLLFFSFCAPLQSHASGSYGWYQPIAEDSLGEATGCGANEARVDIALKEHNSYDDINPSGTSIKLRVVKKSNGQIIDSTPTRNNSLVSDSICFNPAQHALLPTVVGGANYRNAGGVALSFEPASTPLIKGNHIRGYIHLLPTDPSTPNVSHVSPAGGSVHGSTPDFHIWNSSITPTYNSTEALETSLYVRRLSTGKVITLGTYSTPLTTGESTMVPSVTLASGWYRWFFHQKLNGVSNVMLSGILSKISGFPVSSLSQQVGFFIDLDKPNLTHTQSVVWRAPDDSTLKIKVTGTATDNGSGLKNLKLDIWDSANNSVLSSIANFGASPPQTSRTITANNVLLNGGETYTIKLLTTDNAGNEKSVQWTYTADLGPTIVANPHDKLSANSVRIKAQVNRAGTSPIETRKLCYSTASTNITTSGNCVTYAGGTLGDEFTRDLTSLSPAVYYYQAWTKNTQGYSAVSNVRNFLIGTPGPGAGCPLQWRCSGTNSQIYFCNNTNGYVTNSQIAYCVGNNSSCFDPSDPSTYTITPSNWHTIPAANQEKKHQVFARLQYTAGWSGWSRVGEITPPVCSPAAATAPGVDSPTFTGISGTGPGTFEATLGGRVYSFGTETGGTATTLTWRGVCWSTASNMADQHCFQDGALTSGTFTKTVDNLPEQRIYFRAQAKNLAGKWGFTPTRSFVPGATNPTMGSTGYGNLQVNSMDISGTVTDTGGAPIVRRLTQWCRGATCDINNWPTNTTCLYDFPTGITDVPHVFAKTCPISPSVTSITAFRARTCVVNLNNLWQCSHAAFEIDPDSVGSTGSGESTLVPQ